MEETAKRVSITDRAVKEGVANLGCSWGVGNALMVFSGPRGDVRSGDGRPSTAPGTINDVRFETALFTPVMRKLVNESSQAFLTLQKEEDGGIALSRIGGISRQYRSIIRDCQEQLDSRNSLADNEEEEEAAAQLQSALLYKLELIWHLVEVLFIDKTANGMVLHQLLEWISLHFPACEEKAKNVLNGEPDGDDDKPENHSDFWDAIILFVLQGKMEHARTLLRLHSEMGTDPFNSMDELMKRMPQHNVATTAAAQFEVSWRRWQTEVTSRIEEGDFATDAKLSLIARILCGSETAFTGEGSPETVCETWYEWMIGKLLFTNPTVKFFDLPTYAEEAIGRFGGLSAMTTLDSVILASFEMDVTQIINELCNTLDNFWFPAHLIDLIQHARDASPSGQPEELKRSGEALREFLLLNYATCLMSHNSLWQIGVVYFDHCPTQGKHRLELLLERVPLSTAKKAEKVISVAGERGMTSVVTSTCRVMGTRALRNGRIGSAMTWGLKSRDAQFTTFLADQLLKSYCEEGAFDSADLLDNLGSCMVVSERLTFLAKYREFHRLQSRHEFKTAAELLHSLLWSRLAPKYFWVTLLIDTLPFLADGFDAVEVADPENVSQGPPRFFSSEQTYELLHCLQELTSESELPKKQKIMLEDHEGQIRMRLAKNLAVSLMNEGDVSG